VFCDKRRPCITLPGPDRTRRFEFKLVAGEKNEDLLAPEMVQHLLVTHGADPRATIRRKVVYRFHARAAPRWSVGPVYLAGDAAHLSPPFAGQGMNSGIRDAHNLAWKLAAVLDKRAGPGLLESYDQERKDHVWQMIQLALRMGQVMSPKTWLRGFLMQSAFLALKLWPPARDYIAEMKYKPPPRFRAGFLIPDGKGRKTMIGRLIPQPAVRTADNREVLLDDLLGHRFALLLRTADPAKDFARLCHPVWERLDVVRVALVPANSAVEPGRGVVVARPASPALDAALADYPNCALLLRPDHYVAAAIPLDDADAASRTVENLLNATWRSTAASVPPLAKPLQAA
jgi:3-(3-hydroxy-phenyl)propionate hydroxylase